MSLPSRERSVAARTILQNLSPPAEYHLPLDRTARGSELCAPTLKARVRWCIQLGIEWNEVDWLEKHAAEAALVVPGHLVDFSACEASSS